MKPGETFTYKLVAEPQSAGVWPYHDHSPSMSESIEGGLYGALSILGRDEQAPDREFVVYLSSHLGFMTIDGRAFVGNTPVFQAKVGDVVQWDVLAIGDDFHTFHVHGHRWLHRGRAARHAGDRPGRELQDPLARGHPGHVALPLPRREPHDERHDRHLPREQAMKRALVPMLIAVALVLAVGAAAADAPVRTVTMPGKLYDPSHLDVLVGTTVTWKNDDAINHTVTADGDAFSSGYVPPGGSFSFTFAKQGRYAFHCTIHKFMKGEVDVFGLVLSGPEGPVLAGQPRRVRRARAGRSARP